MDTNTQAEQIQKPVKVRDVWGLKPPPGVQLWWGARAIYEVIYIEGRKGTRRKPGHRSHWEYDVSILWDRNGIYTADGAEVSGEAHKEITKWLDTRGLKLLRKLVKSEQLFRDEDRMVRLEDTVKGRTFCIEGNPHQSHGYLYICAWKKA